MCSECNFTFFTSIDREKIRVRALCVEVNGINFQGPHGGTFYIRYTTGLSL